jgi:hypothetical protein
LESSLQGTSEDAVSHAFPHFRARNCIFSPAFFTQACYL